MPGQVAGLADRVDRVSWVTLVSQEVDKVGIEINQEVRTTSGVLSDNLIVNLPK